jgi:Esterase PHB depolymerase
LSALSPAQAPSVPLIRLSEFARPPLYDQAGALLQYIYGPLKPPAKSLTGRIVPFNQREFASSATGMADTGFLYVPKSCDQGVACKVHVAFHGCKQSAAVVGDDFYEKTNYNYWADTNNILVLYPQVNASTIPFNPQGCWDWFGYTGPDYAVKSGSQLTAVNAMVGCTGRSSRPRRLRLLRFVDFPWSTQVRTEGHVHAVKHNSPLCPCDIDHPLVPQHRAAIEPDRGAEKCF